MAHGTPGSARDRPDTCNVLSDGRLRFRSIQVDWMESSIGCPSAASKNISPLLQYCEAERAAVPNPVSSPARASIRFASVGPRGLGSEVDRVFSAGDGVLVPTVQLGFVSPC